ncbi:arginine deiminase [Enterococcus silesiacus]|uniref:Arginine deiminase n=1 Tax=Enterococcus silesiacus TaxID=332949 RepID=A0A0S3KDW9_9ENTE|nr:arginine deiminase family protein [Enterococcus silesiacus]ALS02502.1 arginine deiminase [Enterococcus silesiacus]OJG93587.1 arginine deiminase [Enterococcus silesiacus]
MNINVYNEYDPLKTVIIGDAQNLFFPDSHDIEKEKNMPTWKKFMTNIVYRLLRGKRVPRFIVQKFRNELAEFEKLLLENDITVLKVAPITLGQSEPFGLGQMYARDSVMCVGDLLIEGHLQIEMRKKERLGYKKLIEEIKKKNNVATISQSDPVFLEGGDVLVDYPNVFVGIGKYASNIAGIAWLKEQLNSDWHIIPVFLNDDAILHLDCCMTIIAPKTAIIHRDSLKQLPEELQDYTFIPINAKTRQEMGGNVLVIGEKKVIVQKRHQALQKELLNRGFTVLPLSFTWHTLLDGAFRCASCPLERRK